MNDERKDAVEEVEIDALSDEDLESVAGGIDLEGSSNSCCSCSSCSREAE